MVDGLHLQDGLTVSVDCLITVTCLNRSSGIPLPSIRFRSKPAWFLFLGTVTVKYNSRMTANIGKWCVLSKKKVSVETPHIQCHAKGCFNLI